MGKCFDDFYLVDSGNNKYVKLDQTSFDSYILNEDSPSESIDLDFTYTIEQRVFIFGTEQNIALLDNKNTIEFFLDIISYYKYFIFKNYYNLNNYFLYIIFLI